tara:strand:+ start:72 stop:776 length:705 start_codon:yes stop_codon:yes gene_type:complete
MRVLDVFSNNFNKIPSKKRRIKFIILHYTGMQSTIESISRLKSEKFKVSCHYLISKNGHIYRLVSEKNVAWHAGKSRWREFVNLNTCSVGIEIQNKGHGKNYEMYDIKQVSAVRKLCLKLRKKYKIPLKNILGHSDISPLRKKDPGEKFPWNSIIYIPSTKKLLKQKIKEKRSLIRENFFKNLKLIGYNYFKIKTKNPTDRMIIKAFQMRYFPEKVTGKIDKKTYILSQLLAQK